DRRCPHRCVPCRQLTEQIVGGKGGTFGLELLVGASFLLGPRRRFLQGAFNRVATCKHFGDVAGGDLGLEFGVGHGLRSRHPILHRQQSEQEQVPREPGGPAGPASAARGLPFRQTFGTPWTTGRLSRWWHRTLTLRTRRLRGVLSAHLQGSRIPSANSAGGL